LPIHVLPALPTACLAYCLLHVWLLWCRSSGTYILSKAVRLCTALRPGVVLRQRPCGGPDHGWTVATTVLQRCHCPRARLNCVPPSVHRGHYSALWQTACLAYCLPCLLPALPTACLAYTCTACLAYTCTACLAYCLPCLLPAARLAALGALPLGRRVGR